MYVLLSYAFKVQKIIPKYMHIFYGHKCICRYLHTYNTLVKTYIHMCIYSERMDSLLSAPLLGEGKLTVMRHDYFENQLIT